MVCNYKILAPIAVSVLLSMASCSDDSSNAFAPTGLAESSSSSSNKVAEPTEVSSSSIKLALSSSAISPLSCSTASPSSSSTASPSSSSTPIEDPSSSSRMNSVGSSSLQNDKPSSSSSTLSPSSSSTPIEDLSSGSQYFWNDEFDGDAIDNSKWTYDIGTGSSGWGNNEWEYYTDRKENAYIKDGILHIRAQKEDYKGSKYTSARMLTKGKFAFKYGTVEARIALPTGKGIWPAFWMLGENFDTVGWPACGEIDIIEAVNSENIVYGTNHWANGSEFATYGNNTGNYRDQKHEMDITQFHTYKFTWDEKYIRMFVDDFMYHEILIENSTGDTEEFHKPFFFLLNVAVAGNWPGFEVDDTQFPNEMLVDYIRVYK